MFALNEDATEEDKKEALKSYLQSKYPDRLKQEADLSKPADIVSSQPQTTSMASEYDRLANDDTEIKDAIDQQRRAKNAAMFGDALSSLVTARGAASGYKRDGSFFDRVGSMNDSRVADARNAKQSKIDSFLKKDQLNYQDSERKRQEIMRGREDSEYNRSQASRQQEDDSASEVSKNYQNLASKMVGGKKDFSNMSATQLKQVMPSLEKLYSIDENNRTRRDQQNQQAFENSYKRDETKRIKEEKEQEKEQALKTPYGKANTVKDAEELKQAHVSKQSFDSKVNEMIELRENYGVEYLNRDVVERGKQLSKDLLLEYKNMAKLGVLSISDEKIINAIIPPDPLGQDFALGQDPLLHRLKKFKEDSDKTFNENIKTRTREGMSQFDQKNPTSNLNSSGSGKAKTIIQDGHTYTLNEKTGEYE